MAESIISVDSHNTREDVTSTFFASGGYATSKQAYRYGRVTFVIATVGATSSGVTAFYVNLTSFPKARCMASYSERSTVYPKFDVTKTYANVYGGDSTNRLYNVKFVYYDIA